MDILRGRLSGQLVRTIGSLLATRRQPPKIATTPSAVRPAGSGGRSPPTTALRALHRSRPRLPDSRSPHPAVPQPHRRTGRDSDSRLASGRAPPRRSARRSRRRRGPPGASAPVTPSTPGSRTGAPVVRSRPSPVQLSPPLDPRAEAPSPRRRTAHGRHSSSAAAAAAAATAHDQCVNCIWYWLPKGSMSTISDQKKRTLEALQQQYTAAKAKKLQDEQVKSQKKSNFNTPKRKFDAPRKDKGLEITPRQTYAQPSPHKGVAFSSSNRQQKPSASSSEEINPVYGELSCAFHDNLSKDGVSDLDGTEVVHSVIYDIIQKGGDAGKITKGAKKLKLEKGILLDNYVQRGPRLVDAQARSLLIHSKRSKRHMSLKQHKKCGSFDLDGTFHKYDFYKPMHEMWKDYIRELMKVTPKKKLSENLLSADLHGALLIVAECKAASYQGVNGIMIRDTAETFGIISEDNRLRVVPKAGSVFILQADCWKVTLIGDKLSPREKLKEDQRQHRAQSQIR